MESTILMPPGRMAQAAASGISPADAGVHDPSGQGASGFTPDIAAEMKTAQAKDRGLPASLASAKKDDSTAPADVPVKPVVPGAPKVLDSDEWKPRGEKASQQWDELKARHQTESLALKAEIDKTKAELSAAKSAGASPDEIKTLKEELNQYRETLKDVAIERDPEFKARFSVKEKSAIDAAKMAAGDSGDRLEELLKQPTSAWRDEQINGIVEDLSTSAQRRVNAALGLLEQIDVERFSEIATRRSEFDKRQAMSVQQQQQQHTARLQEFNQAFESELRSFTDSKAGHPFLMERSGDDAHNKEVTASKDLASALHKSFMAGELTASDIAKAMIHVSMSERMVKAANASEARALKAEKALDRLRGVQPGDGRNGAPSADNTDDAAMTPEAARSKALKDLKTAQQQDRMKSIGMMTR